MNPSQRMIRLQFPSVILMLVLTAASARSQTPPQNDMFADRIMLTGSFVVATGSNVGATRESFERPIGFDIGGKSVWWSWTAPSDGQVTVDTQGSSFDTLLVVYRGNSQTALTSADDSLDGLSAKVTFWGQAGTNYQICVDGHNPSIYQTSGTYLKGTNFFNTVCGDIVLTIRQGLQAPSISTHPPNLALLPGETLNLTCAASPLPLSYQWRRYGTNLDGASQSSYVIANAQPGDAGVYSVIVSNLAGTSTSWNALVVIAPIVFSLQPQSGSVGLGYTFAFQATARSALPLDYQWTKDGMVVPSATNSTYNLTNTQMADAGLYTLVASNEFGTATSSNASLILVPYTFTTLAGWAGNPGDADGFGPGARFRKPVGVALDTKGNLYVTEWWNQMVRKVTPQGVVSTVAGKAATIGTNDGPGLQAMFHCPEGIALDLSGNLYVADNFNQTIRKITPEGLVTTLAGVPGVGGWRDGPAATALFYAPSALAFDTATNLYVAEWYNQSIRKIAPDGFVTTLIGDKLARNCFGPDGLAVDPFGNFYLTSQEGSVRYVTQGGLVTVLTSSAVAPYGGTLDNKGNYYVAGSILNNSAVWRLAPDRSVVRLAGNGVPGFADGAGSAARFNTFRNGIAIDGLGNLYIADDLNHAIRKGVPFAVTDPPRDQAVAPGASVTLSVGVGPFSYQWLYGGIPLNGQTNTSLEIGPMYRTNAGVYSVVVTAANGNSITFNATVRVLVPPVMETPEVVGPGTNRLLFQGVDGGLPYDLGRMTLEWRTNLPSGIDTNWLSISSSFYVTNGFGATEDTNVVSASRFYRILEQ